MPTTTRSRTEKDSRTELELEALGAGRAPGLPGDETGERERAGLGAGQSRRGAPAGDSPGLPAGGLVDEAVDRATAAAGSVKL